MDLGHVEGEKPQRHSGRAFLNAGGYIGHEDRREVCTGATEKVPSVCACACLCACWSQQYLVRCSWDWCQERQAAMGRDADQQESNAGNPGCGWGYGDLVVQREKAKVILCSWGSALVCPKEVDNTTELTQAAARRRHILGVCMELASLMSLWSLAECGCSGSVGWKQCLC